MDTDMTDKVALVTGAARGLGRSTAMALGKAGARLMLVDLDPDGLEETRQALAEAGAAAHVHVADLTDPEACAGAVDAAIETFGRLDALCNIAGIVYCAHSDRMPLEQWNRTMAVNLTAPYLLIRAAIPHLLAANGAVVNVASSAGFVGQAYFAAYTASKAALVHLTRSLAMEFMHKPIRFNTVAPGPMPTTIGAHIQFDNEMDRDLINRYMGIRGAVEVADVAEMIAFLSSDAARSYHGACINIDAGVTAG